MFCSREYLHTSILLQQNEKSTPYLYPVLYISQGPCLCLVMFVHGLDLLKLLVLWSRYSFSFMDEPNSSLIILLTKSPCWEARLGDQDPFLSCMLLLFGCWLFAKSRDGRECSST